MKRGFKFGFGALFILALCAHPLPTRAADYAENKRKLATVALFGLWGAALGLVTVAAAADPQSRIGNIPTGLFLGAVVGAVYVYSFDSGAKLELTALPVPGAPQLALGYRF